MRKRNTMSVFAFYIVNAIIMYFLAMEYTKRVIGDLPGSRVSIIFLGIIEAICFYKGLNLTDKDYRNLLIAAVNSLVPLQIHFILMAVLNTTSNLKWIAVSLVCGITCCVAYYIAANKVISENVRVRSKQKIKAKCKIASRTIIAICLAFPLLTSMYIDTSYIPARKQAVYSLATWDEDATLSANLETLRILREKNWSELSNEEKDLQISTIKMVESNILGINPNEIEIVIEELGPGTQGSYDHTRRRIKIDVDLYNHGTGAQVLSTLCHEFFHAYENWMVALLAHIESDAPEFSSLKIFRESQYWKTDFKEYLNPDDSYEEYWKQEAELSSRVYAANSVKEYFEAIDKYISEEPEKT